MDDKNKKFLPGPKEVIKNRVFGMPTSKLTRHQRVSFTALIKIAYDNLTKNPNMTTFEFDTKEFFKMIGISPKRKQSHLFSKIFVDDEGWEQTSEEYSLEKALNQLVNKSIDMRYKDDDGETYKVESISLVSYISLTRSKIIFRFDEWVREKIYVINNSYVMKMPIIASLKSGYSVTLFEQIEQRRDFKRWEISVNALRKIFGLEDSKYQKFSDFRKFVLESAEKEIEEKTSYNIRYEYKKTGRKISKVIITWYINKTSLIWFQEFMRSKFINTPLFKTKAQDGSIHVIQISTNGMLYNGNDPDYYYPTEKAKELWKWMYEHQDHLLIKDKATATAEFNEDDFSKYYGADLLLDGEMYNNIILITPTKSKLKVKFYSGEMVVMSENEFMGCVII